MGGPGRDESRHRETRQRGRTGKSRLRHHTAQHYALRRLFCSLRRRRWIDNLCLIYTALLYLFETAYSYSQIRGEFSWLVVCGIVMPLHIWTYIPTWEVYGSRRKVGRTRISSYTYKRYHIKLSWFNWFTSW